MSSSGKGHNETFVIANPMEHTLVAKNVIRDHVPENGGTCNFLISRVTPVEFASEYFFRIKGTYFVWMEQSKEAPQKQLEEEFLSALADFSPTIPEELTEYYLRRSGFQTSDQKMLKLVSLAAEKFISDVAADAMMQAKLRQQRGAAKKTTVCLDPSQGVLCSHSQDGKEKITLTMEDLSLALKDYGVEINKPLYYASKPGSVKEKKDSSRRKAY